jgi:mRNA interferase MazF
MAGYLPDRGDLVHLNFTPSAGREMSGEHYALVVSPRDFGKMTGKAVVCPITSTIRHWPFEVLLPAGHLPRKRGMADDRDSVILCDQFRVVDFAARRMTRVGTAAPEVVDEVIARILPVFQASDKI